jgi:hypothetical protein
MPVHHAKKAGEWISLFDGKTTTGWHGWKQDKAGAAWKVEDGTIHLDPSGKDGRGDLVTNDAFENFDLKLE